MDSELFHECYPLPCEEHAVQSTKNNIISSATLKWSTWFFLTYFGVRLIYFSLNVSSFVPPDEVTHAGLCRIFATSFLIPDNSPNTYKFGLVTNTPWLYYWSMGKLLHLNFFGLPSLVFLRLLNIPLAFCTVWYIMRTLRLFTDDRLSQLLLVVVMTNIAMFSMLSATVSYDNLTNLLAAMSIYYLFSFFIFRSKTSLINSILCQLAGCLTKITFLPLALVLVILLVVHEIKKIPTLPTAATDYIRSAKLRAGIFTLIILVALGLNIHLYAGNYLTYGTLTPTMSDVVSAKNSMQYRIAARETIFRLYTEEKISYMEALQMAGDIEHPGDKSDTFFLLMNYENLKRNPALWMGPLQYVRIWIESIAGSIFGIKGHLHMFKELRQLLPVYLIMALTLLSFILRWRPRKSGWLHLYLAAIFGYYSGYLLYKINYPSYLYYGTPGITLQGRYLFPVIGPICILSCFYLLGLFRSDKIRLSLALATAALFIVYDFPWFITHATPQWYEWMPR